MRLRSFFFFTFLGTARWVSPIAGGGDLFGRHWSELMRVLGRVNLVILLVTGIVALYLVWTRRARSSE